MRTQSFLFFGSLCLSILFLSPSARSESLVPQSDGQSLVADKDLVIAERESELSSYRKLIKSLSRASALQWKLGLESEFRSQEKTQNERIGKLGQESEDFKERFARAFEAAQERAVRISSDSESKPGALEKSGSQVDEGLKAGKNALLMYAASLKAFQLISSVSESRTIQSEARNAARPQDAAPESEWKAVVSILEPFSQDMIDSRLNAEHRIFSLSLLARAYSVMGFREKGVTLLERYFSSENLDTRPQVKQENRTLLLTFYGDLLFEAYRYRESLEVFKNAHALAKAYDGSGLLPHLRLRVFWSAYRSGSFDISIGELRSICTQDQGYWQNDQQGFLDEVARVGGTVFYRKGSVDELQEFAKTEKFGSCRSKVVAHYIEKLSQSGRFVEAVRTYDQLVGSVTFSSDFVSFSRTARDAASRDRPGIGKDKAHEIVKFAVPLLVRQGVWAKQFAGFKNPVVEEERSRFIRDYALETADVFFDRGLQSKSRADFFAAAELYRSRLTEVESFEDSASVTFRLGFSYYKTGQLDEALSWLTQSTKLAINSDERQSALETISSIWGTRYLRDPEESSLRSWQASCDRLMSEYPQNRSLQIAMEYFIAAQEREPEVVLERLISAFLLLASTKNKFQQVGNEAQSLLVRLITQMPDKEASVRKLSQVEKMFRGYLNQNGQIQIEQVNHSHVMAYYSTLKREGRTIEGIALLRNWLMENDENLFAMDAALEVIDRNFELRNWTEVRRWALVFLELEEKRLSENNFQTESAASIKTSGMRVRLLLGLAEEALFDFSLAFSRILEVSQSDSPSAKQARSILVERYMSFVDDPTRAKLLELSYLDDKSRYNTLLYGLEYYVTRRSWSDISVWLARINLKKSENGSIDHQNLLSLALFMQDNLRVNGRSVSFKFDNISRDKEPRISDENFRKSGPEFQKLFTKISRIVLFEKMRSVLRLRDFENLIVEMESLPDGVAGLTLANQFADALVQEMSSSRIDPNKESLQVFEQKSRLKGNSQRLFVKIWKASLRDDLCSQCNILDSDSQYQYAKLMNHLIRNFGYVVSSPEILELLGVFGPELKVSLFDIVNPKILDGALHEHAQ